MSEMKRCPKCQAEIPAGAPEGLCPQCLLQAALDPRTADSEPKTAAYTPIGSGFVPPAPAELQSAFPHLEILELLGKGGMGAVYKARQTGLDRLVAVKILPPEVSQDSAFAERFTREARALAMLNHPNIVGIYDSGTAGGYYYFVMEYLDGVNLRQAMRSGELKSAEALKIVPQICEALQFAHDEGIVHRDIKPENVLLDKRGRVKIADFGLAKLLGKTAPDISLTGTQQVMGTMHYMAPEQLEGSRDVDHRADIYSLGVTFYEMLTGELPIGRFAAPSKIVQIDVRLDEVVLRSLEKSPEQRYQQASEIKTEVEGIVRAPTDAVPPTAPALGSALELLPNDKVDAKKVVQPRERPMRKLTAARLAALLSGLYLIGIIVYAVAVWRLTTTENVDVDSFLVYREAVRHTGERDKVQRGVPYMSDVYARVEDRFDWLVFCVATVAGVGVIWLLFPGTAWLVGGPQYPPPNAARIELKNAKPPSDPPEQRHPHASEIKTEVEDITRAPVEVATTKPAPSRAQRLFKYLRSIAVPVLVAFGVWTVTWTGIANTIGEGGAWILAPCATLLTLLVFWVHRNFGFASVRPYLPYVWTGLCLVLFVQFLTPYERNRALWSGYVDGGIWPYRETNDCAISLEPTYPRFKRVVIREKTEIALSGNPNAHKNARQSDGHGTSRLTYDIELQLYGGNSRHLTVDALDGMSWKADERSGGRSGSILDATSLAEWLRADEKGGEPEEALKDRRDAQTLQARSIADIIQRASREPYVFTYGGTREYTGGNFVSGAGVKVSRLEDAANHHGRGTDIRNPVFKYVPGWDAAESIKSEPVVPILYVGVPLMLAVWGFGLWLLLRRRRVPAAAA
jgi:predicted Ser/Thr protein kinase